MARFPEVSDCYDPVRQEEQRQNAWDKFADTLPVCTLCHRRLYPGDKFHTASYQELNATIMRDDTAAQVWKVIPKTNFDTEDAAVSFIRAYLGGVAE